jgi:hypothetical protein
LLEILKKGYAFHYASRITSLFGDSPRDPPGPAYDYRPRSQ